MKQQAWLCEILSLAEKVAITADVWTALTTEPFFTDWVVQSAILQTRSIPERHSEYISKYILKNENISFSVCVKLNSNKRNIDILTKKS